VLPGRLAALAAEPAAWRDAIGKLIQYAAVRSEDQGQDGSGSADATSLRMHRLLHLAVRGSIAPDEREALSHAAHDILTAADPEQPSDIARWSQYAELVPHLEPTFTSETTDAATQQLVLGCLRYLYLSGEYWSGLRLAENVARSWRLLLGEAHPQFRALVHHRANLLRSSGGYGQAELIERAVVEDIEARQNPDDPDLLRAMSGLAASLRGLARYEEALQSSRTVLDGYRRLFGERDGKTFDAMNNLEVSLRLLGRYEEALELNGRTLDGRREVLGSRHPRTLYSEVMRAWDLRLLGRLAEAADLQERNVHLHREVLGVDHPQTLRAEQSRGRWGSR
jgi:tetratricopeptide (TPR) repeat protein